MELFIDGMGWSRESRDVLDSRSPRELAIFWRQLREYRSISDSIDIYLRRINNLSIKSSSLHRFPILRLQHRREDGNLIEGPILPLCPPTVLLFYGHPYPWATPLHHREARPWWCRCHCSLARLSQYMGRPKVITFPLSSYSNPFFSGSFPVCTVLS